MKTMTRISRRVKPVAAPKTIRPFAEGLIEPEPIAAVPFGWGLIEPEPKFTTIPSIVTRIRVAAGTLGEGTYSRTAGSPVWTNESDPDGFGLEPDNADYLFASGAVALVNVDTSFYLEDAPVEMEAVSPSHDRPYHPSDVELANVLGYDLARLGFTNVAPDSTREAVIQAFQDGYAQGEAEIERDMQDSYDADIRAGRALLMANVEFE